VVNLGTSSWVFLVWTLLGPLSPYFMDNIKKGMKVGRLQKNPSIWWVHKKSIHAHPLAWHNNKCCFASQLPTFSVVYIQWDLNFGQNYLWHKIEVLLGMLIGITWELGEPLGNMMRTCWEHIGNKEEKQILMHPRVLFCFVLETTSLPSSSIQIKIFSIWGWGNACSFGPSPLILCLKNGKFTPN